MLTRSLSGQQHWNGYMESKVIGLRKYQVYDGDTLIGIMTCIEGEKLLGVARRRFAECARDGGKLKNRSCHTE